MPWIFYSLISLFSDATATLTQRVLMKGVKSDPAAYMIVFQFIVAGLIGLYLITTKSFKLPETIPYFNIGLSAMLIAVGSLFLFKSLKIIEASEQAILSTSGVFWNLLIASLFLNEIITSKRLIGSLLIVMGVVIVSWKKGQRLKISKGAIYALISAAAFGIGFANDAYILQSFDVLSYLFFGFLLPGIIILILKPKSVKLMKPLLTPSIAKKMILFCVLYGIQAVTIFKAYQAGGDASQIYPIAKTYVFIVVILAAIFLKERDDLKKKLLAATLAFAGVMVIR